jgi:hypothetical protein
VSDAMELEGESGGSAHEALEEFASAAGHVRSASFLARVGGGARRPRGRPDPVNIPAAPARTSRAGWSAGTPPPYVRVARSPFHVSGHARLHRPRLEHPEPQRRRRRDRRRG